MGEDLGVFAGGFDLDAACAISADGKRGATANVIGRLADKSLLVAAHGSGNGRWQMLDTVRAYALEQLTASGEEPAVRERHLRCAAQTAAALEQRAQAAGGSVQAQWRPGFDAVADDLRAALVSGAGPGPDGMRHRLARSLGHLAYAHRYLAEARGHFERAAGLAPGAGQAAADLLAQARVAAAEGRGELAFDLLRASAGRAKTAGDDRARSTALAEAVTVAHRIAGTFKHEVPYSRLRALLAEAARTAPADDPVTAAQLAAAAAWNAGPEKATPDPQLAAAALAAARRAGDRVLISGAPACQLGAFHAQLVRLPVLACRTCRLGGGVQANGRLHDDHATLEESLAGWRRIGSRFEHACTLLLMPDRAAQGRAELDALGCPAPAT